MHASGPSDSAAAALPQSTGLPWSGLVRSRSLPCLLPAHALPDGACPPVGRLGLTAPPARVLCAATTATVPRSGCCAWRALPDPWPASLVCGVPAGLVGRSKRPDRARACGPPVPHSGSRTRRQGARPRSRLPPLQTCPARSPRWCPAPLPERVQDDGLPGRAHRRLPTTLPLAGRHHAACLLAPPGSVRPLTGRHAGALLTGWRGFHQGGLVP